MLPMGGPHIRLALLDASICGREAVRQLDDIGRLAEINSGHRTEAARIEAMTDFVWALPEDRRAKFELDPFSASYGEQVQILLAEITGRDGYDPERDELANYLNDDRDRLASHYVPNFYRTSSSRFVGDMLQSFGAVLKALDVKAGDSILEYGPGDGQISLNLARMGCDVTVVDIEQRYLDLIHAQAEALGLRIQAMRGQFGDAPPGKKYDRIFFFEAFHHALDHQSVLHALRDHLAEDGRVVFAGEPIIPVDGYYRPTVQYPWGPRLDGLSLTAMQAHGWCELGFHREYFVELLMRSGFAVSFRQEPSTDRGSAYIARVSGQTVDLGAPVLIEAVGMPDCWHPGEGAWRWAKAAVAGIPLDRTGRWRSASLDLLNPLPIEKRVVISSDGGTEEFTMVPHETRTHTFPLAESGPALRIAAPVHKPSDLSSASGDNRELGIAVSAIRYS